MLVIFSLVTENNEIPCFKLMKQKLNRGLERDSKMLTTTTKLLIDYQSDIFKFKVSMTKDKYIKMLQQRYISCLVNLNKGQISNGIKEIKKLFSKKINFIEIISPKNTSKKTKDSTHHRDLVSKAIELKFILFRLIFSFIISYEKIYIIVYFNTEHLICCLNEHDR